MDAARDRSCDPRRARNRRGGQHAAGRGRLEPGRLPVEPDRAPVDRGWGRRQVVTRRPWMIVPALGAATAFGGAPVAQRDSLPGLVSAGEYAEARPGAFRRPLPQTGGVYSAGPFPLATPIVPRHVLGRGIRAPSDTLNIACIGVGGRGREDVRGVSIENIYALCDVDDVSAADSYATYPKAKRYKDFREMLDKEAKRI